MALKYAIRVRDRQTKKVTTIQMIVDKKLLKLQ